MASRRTTRSRDTGADGDGKGATLRDVSSAAAVSMMTVSNVINRRYHLMTAETRQRVEAAIHQLGYRRHSSGRSLRLARRFSIGMVVVDNSESFLADPFVTYLVAGLSNGLSQRDYSLSLQGLPAAKLRSATLIRNRETDALCVLLSGPRAERQSCRKLLSGLHQPLLLFQEPLDRAPRDICIVRQDDFDGARQVARRVIGRGARRIVLLVPAAVWPAMEERERGIRSEIQAAGASLTVLVCGNGSFTDTCRTLQASEFDPLPDAVLAGNDQMGIAALTVMRARGICVPGDMLITGFNAFDFWRYSDPLLTTVRSPAYELGALAAGAALDRLQTGRWAKREIVLPVTFEPGHSA